MRIGIVNGQDLDPKKGLRAEDYLPAPPTIKHTKREILDEVVCRALKATVAGESEAAKALLDLQRWLCRE